MRNVRNILIAFLLFLFFGAAYGQSNYDFMNLYGPGVTCGYGYYPNAFHYTDGPAQGRHTLITQQGTDPNTGGELEIIPEGEDRVIRLGDAEAMHTAPGYAEGIEYQFEVNSLYSMLLLKFAVVFQEKVPNDHNIENKPFFSVKITDVNGNLLDECAEYEVSSIDSLPGFHDYQLTPTSLIRWRDWSTIGLDLSRFAGQEVKVTFVTKDCAQGAHYGYAYFNAKCIPNFISASCVNGDVELEAPSYLQSYLWANNDTTQSITQPMPPYPAVLSTSCHLTSFTNCEMDLMATVVWDLDLPSGPQTVHVYNHCKGTPYNGYYFNIDGSELSEAGDYVFMNSIAEYGQCDSPTYLTLIIHVVDNIAVNFGDEICDNEEYNANGFNIDSTLFHLGSNQFNFTHTHDDCCDSVFSLSLIVRPTKSEVIYDTICEGETYVFNGINYNTYSAGSYNDVEYLETMYGCDSIVEMNLVIHKVYDSTIYVSLCQGDIYDQFNFHITETNEVGTINDVQNLETQFGCDSIVRLELSVYPKDTTRYEASICYGESYIHQWDPSIHYDTPAVTETPIVDIYNYTSINNCDSVLILTLNVYPTYDTTITAYVGLGGTYNANGFNITPNGVGTIYQNLEPAPTTIHGCDSLVHLELAVYPTYAEHKYDEICDDNHGNNSYTNWGFNETGLSVAGSPYTFTQHLQTVNTHVDSIVIAHVTVHPKDTTRYEASICYGESYIHQWDPSIHYDTPAVTETPIVDIYNYTSINNCDSVLILTLNVYPTYDTTITAYVGLGGTYNANGFNITPNGVGTIYQNLEPAPTTIHGCDSLVHLELAVYPTYAEHKYDEICDDNHGNNSYTNWGFNETGLSVAGSPYTFTRHLQTVNTHVDSTVIAHVTVYPVYDEHLYGQICEGVPYTNHGFSIQAPQTGEYQLTDLESVYGCDSLVTLHLSVIDHLYVDEYDTICENEIYNNYGFLIDSDTLDPGWHIYSHDAQSSTGCDSTFTLHLLVGENYSVFLNTRGCKYTTIDTLGMSFYLESDEYYDIITLPAVTGCDSTISVNIAVMPADREYFDVELCYGEGYDDDLHGFHIPDTIDPGHYVDSVIYISDNYSVAYYYLDTVCNSYYILNLDVWPLLDTTVYATVCDNNGAFSWNGFHYDGFDYGLRHDTVLYDVRHEQTVHGCDSTIYLELTVHPVLDTIFNESICEYESYSEHGFDQSHNFNITDLAPNQNYYYEFTVNSVITGCDSIVRLNLFVRDVSETQLNISWCQNEEFDSLGFNFTPTEVTVYNEFQIVSNASANGCDSLVYLALDVKPVYHFNDNTYIGLGDDYSGHGFYIQQPTLGHYILDTTYTSIHGCDSTWHVEFDVFPTYGTFVDTAICVGENYIHDPDTIQFIGYPAGTYVNEYHFQTIDGVDSTVFLTLRVLELAENHINIDWCQNDEFNSLGFNIMPTEATTYNETLVVPNGSSYGCDSIVYLTLDVHPVYHNNGYDFIGYGENYSGYGFNLQQPGIGQYILDTTYTSIHGCDSTWHVVLDVFQTYGTIVDTTICYGDDYIHDPDTIQFVGYPVGTYSNEYHFQTIAGVDSTLYLTLHVNPVYDSIVNGEICYDENYTLYNFNIEHPSVGYHEYETTYQTIGGCDSTMYLHLNVWPIYDTLITTFIGTGYDYVENGFELIQPDEGSYDLDTLYYSVNGCDSIVRLHLDVYLTKQTYIYDSICYGEDYVINGFNKPGLEVGTYYDTLHLYTIHNVDSTVYLTLDVNEVYDYTFFEAICHEESYIDHNFQLLAPAVGHYDEVQQLQTIKGCDSIVRLSLEVNPTYSHVILDSVCYGDSYSDYDQNFFVNTLDEIVGLYQDTLNLTSIAGCDSVIYLHLDINPVYDIAIVDTICHKESYTQYGFNIDTPDAGVFNDTLFFSTTSGCDSTLYLDLLVWPHYDTLINVEICHGFDYVDNGFEFLQPGVGTHKDTLFLTTIHGCDSTVAIQLEVYPTYDTYILDSICFDEDYMANGFVEIFPPVGVTHDTLWLESIHGCDSTVYLHLDVYPTFQNWFDAAICEGEEYHEWGFDEVGKAVGMHYDTLYLSTVHGCDSISYLELTVNPTHTTLLEGEICEGEDYTDNGFDILQPAPGDSIYSITLPNEFGCDSTVYLALTVWPKSYRYLVDTVCHGVDYLLNGFKIIQAEVGIAYDTLYLTNSHGCDSTVFMELTVLPEYDTTYVESICYGDDYDLHGFNYIMPEVGHYIDTLMLLTTDGCDSIIYLDLTVNEVYDTLFIDMICQGEDYTQHGFDIIQPAVGFHQDTLWLTTTQACDSLILLNLTVAERADTLIVVDICEGEDYIGNGFEYIQPAAGDYYDSLNVTPVVACDSMVYLELHVHDIFLTEFNDTICEGEDYIEHGFVFMQPIADVYLDTLPYVTASGCDSLVTLTLTVNPRYDITILDTICQGETYDEYGFLLDSLDVGVHYDTLNLATELGCDSIIMLELTVNPRYDITILDTVCQGGTYYEYGFEIDSLVVGVMYDTLSLTTELGCDSIIMLELTVNPRHDIAILDTICEGEDYDEYGFSFLQPSAGLYHDTLELENQFGCDSIVSLALTVNPRHDITLLDTVCEGGTYEEYGFEIDSLVVGVMYDTLFLQNEYGCDSIVTLELTVNPRYDITLHDTICFGEDYENYGFTVLQPLPGMHFDTLNLETVNGCDSIVMLELAVGSLDTTNLAATICLGESYTENGFNLDSLSVGLHYDTLLLTSLYGCDSLVTLELTVNPVHDTLFVDEICEGFSYDEHGFNIIQPSAGMVYDTLWLNNIYGCDSIVRLELTVNPRFEIDFNEEICEGFSYTQNGFSIILPEPGMHYDTLLLQTIHGCDSIVTLALEVHPKQHTLIEAHRCFGEDYEEHGFHYIQPEVGFYLDSLIHNDVFGCDSIVTLNLYVHELYDITITDTICEGDSYFEYGFEVITPDLGVYYDTLFLTSMYGCDSVVKLELTTLPILRFDGVMTGTNIVYPATNMQLGRYEYHVPPVEHCEEYTWTLTPPGSPWIIEDDGPDCVLWVTTEGHYQLKVKIGNICHWDSLYKELYSAFFDIDETMMEEVNIYPNPTKGQVAIECPGMERIIIQSLTGQIMRKEDYDSSDRVVMELETLPRGT